MATSDSIPVTGAEGAPTPSKWDVQVGNFAKAVSKPLEQITTALVALVGGPSDEALIILGDPASITDEDLRAALVAANPPGIPLGVFRKNLPTLRGPQATAPVVGETSSTAPAMLGNLPSLPDDTSFLEMLKVGGVLKPGETEVIAAAKAALAAAVGVYDLPDVIVEKMEEFAEEQEEPVGPQFFELRKMVTRKNYADILSALGADSNFATETRRKAFLSKLNTSLWPAVVGFQEQLVGWQQSWMAGTANPGMMFAALATMGTGGRGALPPGMLAPPDTSGLRAGAEDVVNVINRVFGGLGIPIARVLAADAIRIKQVLSDPALPTLIGATNREMMLKMLKVNVSSDYVRLEQNVTRYVLAIVGLNRTTGNDELSYLSGMFQLGSTIPWDKLPGYRGEIIHRPGSGNGIAARRSDRDPIGIGSGRSHDR